jgi:hypothetical protein
VDPLVDLPVTELPAGSAALRERIPGLLEQLVAQGKVMQVGDATVYQGGGNQIEGVDLAAALAQGAEFSMVRLYPQFERADSAQWARAMTRVREGNVDALQQVGYSGEAPAHPVCREVLQTTGVAGKKGNELLAGVLEAKDRLEEDRNAWDALAQKTRQRMPEWTALQRLLKHAAPLPVHGEVAPQADAILAQRSLLDEPDPVAPLLGKLEQALRESVTQAREVHLHAGTEKLGELTESGSWKQLTGQQQDQIKVDCGLQPLPELNVSSREALLTTLEGMPLARWDDATAALAERIARALALAAKTLEPKAERVIPRHAELRTAADADQYLGDLRAAIMEHIDAGKPVVL